MGALIGSMGHRVKIHKITPAAGKEWGDIVIRDYVVLQKLSASSAHLDIGFYIDSYTLS
jgi:hypothetical protein